VNGIEYSGDRIRFLFRPLRIGTEQARSRAVTWGQGNTVEVFFDPKDPKKGLLDKGLCLGDWIMLFFTSVLLVGGCAGIVHTMKPLFRLN
jgi:hypothetical protein